MERRLLLEIGVLGAFSLLASAPNVLASPSPKILPFRFFKTPSPLAYQIFHQQHPLCRVQGGDVLRTPLDSQEKSYLQNINRNVNHAIRYQEENRDDWSINGISGDCEDYALQKLQTLIQDGALERNNLSLAICLSEEKVLHAVLLVHSIEEDFVLDNRFDHIFPWYKLPYRWLAMENHTNPKYFDLIIASGIRR